MSGFHLAGVIVTVAGAVVFVAVAAVVKTRGGAVVVGGGFWQMIPLQPSAHAHVLKLPGKHLQFVQHQPESPSGHALQSRSTLHQPRCPPRTCSFCCCSCPCCRGILPLSGRSLVGADVLCSLRVGAGVGARISSQNGPPHPADTSHLHLHVFLEQWLPGLAW